jgi:hypothetical protein
MNCNLVTLKKLHIDVPAYLRPNCKKNTGLFCMHIIKAFTHLQVQNIPEKYILKRYTRNSRSVVPWDRHDVSVGGQNETE